MYEGVCMYECDRIYVCVCIYVLCESVGIYVCVGMYVLCECVGVLECMCVYVCAV